ncbi:MAG: serine/threonine protein kinase, partial [Candidatus Nitrosotenuis sp.]
MIPKTLGRFEIVSELGRGAMGVVYKGRDPKLERTVALKVIHFGLNKEDEQQLQVKERFLVEARATAQLQHSNILTIYDVGDEGSLT